MGNAQKRKKKQSKRQKQAKQTPSPDLLDTGCLICGKDDDHPRILLCDRCSGEYHTYCLQPKLMEIPKSAWFCDKCQPNDTELLHQEIAALPTEFTSRFAEICWAQGGVGYGWWPCCIYDPRLTVGSARQEARRHLGKRHLVYFFQCSDTPFSVLAETKIMSWIKGLAENLHLGKAAASYSRARYQLFQKAFQAAVLELDKPKSKRLDFDNNNNNETSKEALLPSPVAAAKPASKKSHLVKKEDPKQKSDVSPEQLFPCVTLKRKRATRTDPFSLLEQPRDLLTPRRRIVVDIQTAETSRLTSPRHVVAARKNPMP